MGDRQNFKKFIILPFLGLLASAGYVKETIIVNNIKDQFCKIYGSDECCIQCVPRFYLSAITKKCMQVSDLCQTWDSCTGACTSCYKGYNLQNGICKIGNSDNKCEQVQQKPTVIVCEEQAKRPIIIHNRDGSVDRINIIRSVHKSVQKSVIRSINKSRERKSSQQRGQLNKRNKRHRKKVQGCSNDSYSSNNQDSSYSDKDSSSNSCQNSRKQLISKKAGFLKRQKQSCSTKGRFQNILTKRIFINKCNNDCPKDCKKCN